MVFANVRSDESSMKGNCAENQNEDVVNFYFKILLYYWCCQSIVLIVTLFVLHMYCCSCVVVGGSVFTNVVVAL